MLVNDFYKNLIGEIILSGEIRQGRNGEIRSIFNPKPFVFDLSLGSFPKVTIKRCSFKKTLLEGLFFITGENNVDDMPKCLRDTWWRPWTDGTSLGNFYGYQLRHKEGYFDQLEYVLDLIKNEPTSRRIVLGLWNNADVDKTVLPACHSSLIQFYVSEGRYLDMYFYQRKHHCASN